MTPNDLRAPVRPGLVLFSGDGQFYDGSGRSKTLAIAAVDLGAVLCVWRLARLRAAGATAGASAP